MPLSVMALARVANIRRITKPTRPLKWLLLSISWLGWLGLVVACQPSAVVEKPALDTTTNVTPITATAVTIPTLQPPVVVITSVVTTSVVTTSSEIQMPSFNLATVPTNNPAAIPSATSEGSTNGDDDIAASPAATPVAAETDNASYPAANATAEPTFTRPAAPTTSANDHFWLGRPVPEGGVVWTDKAYPYGSTRGGTLRPHRGVEFNVPLGTPVFTAASGTVVVAGDDLNTVYGEHTNFYGNLVIIQHDFLYNGQPVYSLYGHLSQVLVNVGQAVGAAEQIAISGGSGVADGPHLHFEVRIGQNDYANTHNPLLWLYPFPGRGVVAGRVVFSNGNLAYEAPVALRRIDGPAPYSATTTYAQGQLNPDGGWQENFALDDVVAGYYEVSVRAGEETLKEELWVYPNQTSFVEITLP